ncbi:ABC transporter permease [Planosporangium mesophilum]|uniref:Peptide ABC transporter permease n=1 Tax=Planosporangium mesophilum TaxID=689768 RepID=A0A8J3X359_9ACTN|nr:ABC transporter permease [Planosporangium mesophilum]NJC82442.1 FtsX-like permease family protein [Planosporangium mesophilum]GII26180.1 peptide ABC transporter permease [Planosporangium mesophilum]
MTTIEAIRLALRAVVANKLRSGLTVLGILIGVAAVILLTAVGNGSAKAIQQSIEQLGSDTLTIAADTRAGGPAIQNTSLTIDLVDALNNRDAAPDVKSVAPVVTSAQTVNHEGTDHSVAQFIGTTPAYLSATNDSIARGSSFTADDVTDRRRVVVLGATPATKLFRGVDPVGKQVTVGGTVFTVVGLLSQKGGTGFGDPNDVAIAPITAVQEAVTGFGPLNQILVKAVSGDRVTAAQSQAQSVLKDKLHLPGTGNQPFRVLSQSQLLAARDDTARTFTVLLAAVAALSLLVGGVGITNIMMVTVTERTREIGIRKALGAPKRTLLTQFLTEATVLSLIGGLLGVVAAIVGSQFTILGVDPQIAPGSIALALGVSVAIGLFFGSYPASRAAGLRPIDALRYE